MKVTTPLGKFVPTWLSAIHSWDGSADDLDQSAGGRCQQHDQEALSCTPAGGAPQPREHHQDLSDRHKRAADLLVHARDGPDGPTACAYSAPTAPPSCHPGTCAATAASAPRSPASTAWCCRARRRSPASSLGPRRRGCDDHAGTIGDRALLSSSGSVRGQQHAQCSTDPTGGRESLPAIGPRKWPRRLGRPWRGRFAGRGCAADCNGPAGAEPWQDPHPQAARSAREFG